MTKCKRCNTYIYSDNKACKCEPFTVYYPDYYGEELKTIWGHGYEDIVEKVAREINLDDSVYDTNIFVTPVIITDKNNIERSFNCKAMIDVEYEAEEIIK